MGDYSYVIDSTFQPFSMQEMLVPFTAYKEAFEKTEEAYTDLSDKSDKFKYLSETLPEGSKARALYEGYANDLKQRAEDLAHNGLTMGNRRALTSMKRRYQGEIGRLSEADERLKEERKLRQTLNAQDSSRIYSTENLSIDDFLDNNNPNLYSVSGKELYAAGAAAGKAASSRVFSVDGSNRTLNDYYIDYVQKMGYSPETIQRFYEDMSTIPELQRAAADIATQYGVDKNLTGYGLERATKNILRGMMDGAVYQESHSPQRDLGKMTAAESAADARAKQQTAISAWSQGLKSDGKGGFVEDPENINYKAKDLTMKQQQAKFDAIYEPDPNNTDRYRIKPEITQSYGVDPNTGKLNKNSKAKNTEKDFTKRDEALLALKTKKLSNNNGFDVEYSGKRKHYNYVGGLSRHGDKWYHGAIGQDNPGHSFWGFGSTSNVENAWGDFSAEGSDSGDLISDPRSHNEKMKVLSEDELESALNSDPDLDKAFKDRIKDYCIKNNLDYNKVASTYDIQLVAVPNEHGSDGTGYLVAISPN